MRTFIFRLEVDGVARVLRIQQTLRINAELIAHSVAKRAVAGRGYILKALN